MMRKSDEMDDERLMSDDAVEDAVLRYLDESPEVVSGMTPSRDLWPDIEARIGARVLPLGRDSVAVHRMRRRPAWLAMAAAAAFLVASTAGVTYVLTKRFVPLGAATHGAATSQVATAPTTAPTTSTHTSKLPAETPGEVPAEVPAEMPAEVPTQVASATRTRNDAPKGTTSESRSNASSSKGSSSYASSARRTAHGPSTSLVRYPVTGSDEARVTYDDEISRLHGVLDARRDQLDPATVATVERNLRIIDDAITQARTALAKDPHSRMLNEQLDRTLAKKTQLLRAATLLPSV